MKLIIDRINSYAYYITSVKFPRTIMDRISIKGGNPLKGKIFINGAKNAALPIIAAAMLTDEEVILKNIPVLHDITSMIELLDQHGVKTELSVLQDIKDRFLKIKADGVSNFVAPYEIVRKFRASILVLGPLLARYGQAKVSLPGGCAIGVRPIDMHIAAMEKLGATVSLENGYINAVAPNGLIGAEIIFDKISVGATENIIMAACLAKGITTIKNAALEPEIIDLIKMLNSMGARISGGGSSTLTIEGVQKLKGTTHVLIGDRIEAGTYAIAVIATGGDLELLGIDPVLLEIVLSKLEQIGVVIEKGDNRIRIIRDKKIPLNHMNLETEPFPGFPTDLQAQMMVLAAIAEGKASYIVEHIFENRFMHVAELCRLGANISIHGNTAVIQGVNKLVGAQVMASDIRASVSLIIAGLVADGETVVNRVYHLYRGYENLVAKLKECGANIGVIYS
jgi:UDP-N-acetylglucosamine 1-carboxyvinyltransferase